MHSSILLSTVVISALVLGCNEEPAPFEPMAVGVDLAVTQNAREPFTTEYLNPCNGEVIEFAGFLHSLAAVTADGSGGFHVVSRYNLTVHGVGQTTGAAYIGNEASTDVFGVKPPYPARETFTLHTNVIGQGQAPDFRQHVTFHVTINAKGELTVSINKFRATCR
jgi:hypothetical protein